MSDNCGGESGIGVSTIVGRGLGLGLVVTAGVATTEGRVELKDGILKAAILNFLNS